MKFLNLDRVIVISFGFFLVMNPTNVVQNILPTLMEEAGYDQLGFYACGMVFFSFAILSLVSVPVVRSFGDKLSLIIGTVSYMIFTIMQILALYQFEQKQQSQFWYNMYWPIYILILITAIFNGWGNALIFITSSKYVNECANESNMGLYNSILLIFNQSSMISGSLLASFLIPDTSKITFLIISVAQLFIACFYFLLLKAPRLQPTICEISQQSFESKILQKDKSQHLSLLYNQQYQSQNELNLNDDQRNEISQTFKLLMSKRMMILFPLMFCTGISMAIYQALLVPMMINSMPSKWTQNQQLQQATQAQIGLGVGEVIGGYINGQIQDYAGTRKAFWNNIIQAIITFGIMFWYNHLNKFHFLHAFGLNFAWGFLDSGMNIFCDCILGFQFESPTLPFSIFYFAQSFACFLFTFVESILYTSSDYRYYLILVAINSLFAWVLFIAKFDLIQDNDIDGQKRNDISIKRKESLQRRSFNYK